MGIPLQVHGFESATTEEGSSTFKCDKEIAGKPATSGEIANKFVITRGNWRSDVYVAIRSQPKGCYFMGSAVTCFKYVAPYQVWDMWQAVSKKLYVKRDTK